MKHSFNELFIHIDPDTERRSFFTLEATKGRYMGRKLECYLDYILPGPTSDGSFVLNERDGSTVKWAEELDGEWVAWYDTKEERDEAVNKT